MFNSANQKTNESIDEYVVHLCQLADSCEIGSLKASLIRNRIVIGTPNESGREQLLRERPVPNLEKVVESLRAAEISRVHKQVIAGKKDSTSVDYADKYKRKPPFKKTSNNKKKNHQAFKFPKQKLKQKGKAKTPNAKVLKCKWCGQEGDHTKRDCPAKDAKCHNCSKIGHYASACHTGK